MSRDDPWGMPCTGPTEESTARENLLERRLELQAQLAGLQRKKAELENRDRDTAEDDKLAILRAEVRAVESLIATYDRLADSYEKMLEPANGPVPGLGQPVSEPPAYLSVPVRKWSG